MHARTHTRKHLDVVTAVCRVGSSKNGGASIEGCGDAGLGNRDGLLLHHLMDGCAVAFLHLVKLIDAAHAHVRKHECATLQHKLLRDGILHTHTYMGEGDGKRYETK